MSNVNRQTKPTRRRRLSRSAAAVLSLIGVLATSMPASPSVASTSAPMASGFRLGQTVERAGAGRVPAAAVATTASRYVAFTPVRVMDSRIGLGAGLLGAGGTADLAVVTGEVAATAGVPANTITAVVLNLTAVDAAGPGFITVWPTGAARPTASALNPSAAGQVIANMVTVPVGPGGQVSLYSLTGGHLVADVQGVYVPAASATAGRLVTMTPTRVLDTRTPSLPFPRDSARTLDVTTAGVPRTASAVILNIAATETLGAGFFTVWPAGATRPVTSNLNIERAGQTIANQTIAGLSNGSVAIYSMGGGHLIVDVTGYITGAADPSSSDGLFVPIQPARLSDTRVATPPIFGARPSGGSTIEIPAAGLAGLPATGMSALALNVTLTSSKAAGFVTVWPARTNRPLASALNAERADQTIGNHVITGITSAGTSMFTMGGAHLIADVTGYYTGSASAVTAPAPPVNPVPDQPPAPPSTGAHAFLYRYSGNRGTGFARWNPCAPLRYKLNASRASAPQRAVLDSVIVEIEATTGIDLVNVGDTDQGLDASSYTGNDAEAVFAFSDPATSPELSDEVIGVGGGDAYGPRVFAGFGLFSTQVTSERTMRALMLHEIGHMLGLDHVDDETELMNPYTTDVEHYGLGDREGLWYLGAAQGCLA